MKTYPLHEWEYFVPKKYKNVKAMKAGEFRPPRKGEWYLSGAIVGAYKAPNDLSTSYHIAKLVNVEKVVTEKITPYEKPKKGSSYVSSNHNQV